MPDKLSFFNNIKDVTIKPRSFFENIKAEKGWSPSIIFFLLLQAILLLVGVIGFMVFGGLFSIRLFFGLISELGFFSIIGIITYTVSILIYHVLILLFRGKQGMLRTFQVFLYGIAPVLILSWIPILNVLAAFYAIYIMIVGISVLQEMKVWKAILIYFIPLIATAIFALILLLLGFY